MRRSNPRAASKRPIVRQIGICVAFIGALSTPALGQATEYTPARKFGRGVAAMTTGFLEIPGNMVAETREHGAGAGIPLGFVFGLGKLVVRELVGVYEFLSAPFEAPAGFRPIIEPEFPWSYFEDGSGSSTSR
jgi:putative exosortase-associated protein (TIGR04073 family)